MLKELAKALDVLFICWIMANKWEVYAEKG